MQLTQTGSSLDNEISGAIEKTKNHIETNQDKLNVDFEAEKAKIILLQDLINSESLKNPGTHENDALLELSKITKKFQISLDRIETFRGYEAVLGVDKPFKLDELKKFEEAYELRHELWNNRSEFKKDRKEWYEGFFRQQDTEETVAKIAKYNKANVKIRTTKLPKGASDKVLDALTDEVN